MGDFVGHPFRGNQWTDRVSEGGGSNAVNQRTDFKSFETEGSAPTPDDNPTGQFGEWERKVLSARETVFAQRSYETAMVTGPAGAVHFEKDGNESSVLFEVPAETAKMRGGVLTHNHPSSGPLSDDDISLAIANGLREIRAVGRDGTLSRFGATQGWWPSVLGTYRTLVQETRDKTWERINRGELTIAQANEGFMEEQHGILLKLAKAYAHIGVYYKRTRRK